MTTTPAISASETKPSSATPGAFDRLTAFDGLFLRAEHINLIESYATDVAFAVGASTGPGVVHGFDVSLHGYELRVSAGLALMADGRPLRTTAVLTARVDDLDVKAGRYFEVGLRSGSWPHGDEAVQGLLCDEPCGCDGGTRRTARTYDGPYLVIRPVDTESGLAEQVTAHRSWLASRRFRQEEDEARRWPATDPRLPEQWPPNFGERARDTLPLAVLLPPLADFDWQVDQWTVRRDKGAPPPEHHWQWRLGMRPRQVFIAQVLQFQVQLNEGEPAAAAASRATSLRGELQKAVESIREAERQQSGEQREQALDELDRRISGFEQELSTLLEAPHDRAFAEAPPGPQLVELPPAGFVPRGGATLETVAAAVETYLACPRFVRNVCTCEPGDIGALFAAAQHRDRTRTPRSTAYGNETGVIDVFVALRNGEPSYDWVLFTRAEQVECPQPTPPEPALDLVTVQAEFDIESIRELGVLTYPAQAWQVPEDAALVFPLVRDLLTQRTLQSVRASVRSDDRRPLGYLRASLLVGPFFDNAASSLPPVETSVASDQQETITVVLGDPILNLAQTETDLPAEAADAGDAETARMTVPVSKASPRKSSRATADPAAGRTSTARKGKTRKASADE
ncbi:hypothetical protein EV645_6514 [Kribbella rubisoli]|uniref:Uncharacterized protein n=1 Tax=Kribbella rubisoli TaxID=3075929 RepID=A0A4Q7WNM7_9ACTN|nr:hypothetical protein [Kribbella rubisoli]RZU11348.1 hypothetical protein EV645_6514 [Kribbella rubisoli]